MIIRIEHHRQPTAAAISPVLFIVAGLSLTTSSSFATPTLAIDHHHQLQSPGGSQFVDLAQLETTTTATTTTAQSYSIEMIAFKLLDLLLSQDAHKHPKGDSEFLKVCTSKLAQSLERESDASKWPRETSRQGAIRGAFLSLTRQLIGLLGRLEQSGEIVGHQAHPTAEHRTQIQQQLNKIISRTRELACCAKSIDSRQRNNYLKLTSLSRLLDAVCARAAELSSNLARLQEMVDHIDGRHCVCCAGSSCLGQDQCAVL